MVASAPEAGISRVMSILRLMMLLLPSAAPRALVEEVIVDGMVHSFEFARNAPPAERVRRVDAIRGHPRTSAALGRWSGRPHAGSRTSARASRGVRLGRGRAFVADAYWVRDDVVREMGSGDFTNFDALFRSPHARRLAVCRRAPLDSGSVAADPARLLAPIASRCSRRHPTRTSFDKQLFDCRSVR